MNVGELQLRVLGPEPLELRLDIIVGHARHIANAATRGIESHSPKGIERSCAPCGERDRHLTSIQDDSLTLHVISMHCSRNSPSHAHAEPRADVDVRED